MICPNCKEDQGFRSRRSGIWERFISIFGFYPYRCQKCNIRRVMLVRQPEQVGEIVPEIVRRRKRLGWRQTRREMLLYGAGAVVVAAFVYLMLRLPNSNSGAP